ncbi:MAG: YggT family protein [Gammaproteobacteria bacterium]|nr:YggT family protein [Gammaproteobacteria bacterium]
MAGGYFADAGLFLVDTVLGLYILIILLRFLFQLVRVDFYNPLSQFIVKASNPPLARLHQLIPSLWGIDLGAIVLLLILEGLRLSVTALMLGHTPRVGGVLILSIGELLKLAVYVVVFSIFVRALLSWVSSGTSNPMAQLLGSFTEPLLAPARRLLPATGGLDLSPIIVFMVLMLVLKLLVQPLLDVGRMLI